MRLTKSTSHAIRILIDCARGGDRLIKVAELSQHLEITQQNVFKIVNLLARAGLIEAMRGRNGGVRLARPASRHPHPAMSCAQQKSPMSRSRTARSAASRSAAAASTRSSTMTLGAFIDVLDQHTLADMAAGQPAEPTAPRRKPASAARPAAIAAALSPLSPRQRLTVFLLTNSEEDHRALDRHRAVREMLTVRLNKQRARFFDVGALNPNDWRRT